MRGLRLGRHARHLPLQPAPQGRRQALDERLLQLQRDGALAEADLLAGEALAGHRRGVCGPRRDDADGQQVSADRGRDADKDRQRVHMIAVSRRMIRLPMNSRKPAKASMTQPSGLTSMGRK